MSSAEPQRVAELATNLAAVRARIADAIAVAGRAPGAVTLIGVSKTFPAQDVATLVGLGLSDAGENRDQEAAPKVARVRELVPEHTVRWHFVGQLQRKKVASVASYADVVHSLDRIEVVDALGRAAVRAERRLDALVQVNLDPEASLEGIARGGVRPNDVVPLAEHILTVPGLRLAGVMALAPYVGQPEGNGDAEAGPDADADADAADAAFARLAVLAEGVRALAVEATMISAGMSGDLEAAIRHGATHVRVGTALFGGRALGSEDVR